MTVTSERAEESVIRANRALAHFRSNSGAAAAAGRTQGLRGWTASSEAGDFQSHDAILRLVAIAEDFSIGRFIAAIEPVLPSDPIVSALWDAELDRSGDTWPKRNTLWKKYKNVNVQRFPRNKQIQGFIQARNSIAHGLGGLTRRQLRNRRTTAQELQEASISVRGNALVIEASHVELCALVVKEFVAWLDASC